MTTFTVNTINDENDGINVGKVSLRDAIAAGNSAAGADIIKFDPSLSGKTIALSKGTLNITSDLTISGLGQDKLTISGNQKSGVFNVSDFNRNLQKQVVIENLKITGSKSASAAVNSSENLTINNSTISGNTFAGMTLADPDFGNGTVEIYNAAAVSNLKGVLTISNSIIANNSTTLLAAGGIFSTGKTTVTNSTVSGNTGSWKGAGIYNKVLGSLTIVNSTISSNSVDAGFGGDGGGIYNLSNLNISNSTIANNYSGRGGGIFTRGQTSITNTTISGNTATDFSGGAIYSGKNINILNSTIYNNKSDYQGKALDIWGIATVGNTIIAGNRDGNGNISNENITNINSLGNNILSSATSNNATDILNISDPGLLPLAFNGGPTQTHALAPNSPALNAGNNSLVNGITFDQRGANFNRIFGPTVDIGAYEATTTPSLSIADVSITEGNSATKNAQFLVSLSNATSVPVTVKYATANGTATANTDYNSTTGTLIFNPGQITQTLSVAVKGDNILESNETFLVNLSNATNSTISDNQGKGTIVNDDQASSSNKLTSDLLIGQVKTLTGSNSADTFVLGDATQAYYNLHGDLDYAKILNFQAGIDKIQLHGNLDHYSLSSTTSGANLYLKDDLIAQVNTNLPLVLNSDNFVFG